MAGRKKRPNGEGSISRRKDGRYEGRYTVRTPDGPKRKAVYGSTRAEVAGKLAKAIAESDAGLYFDAGRLTLGEYLGRWLADAEGRVRPKTHRRYVDLAKIHLLPALGKKRIGAVAPDHLRTLYAARLRAGYSARTVGHAHALLKQVLKQAVVDALIPRNAAEAVRPPRSSAQEVRPLTAGQVRTLFDASKGSRYEALYVVAVTAGLRRGELLGLSWEDVDLGRRVLTVRRTLQQGELLSPKTAKSRRSITLTRCAVGVLEEHRERQAAERAARDGSWEERGLVFPNRVGAFTDADNLCGRHFKPLLREAGLPPIRFHDLRHTCATLLLAKGVHPKIVSEMLGHANISITLDTYSHVIPSLGDAAAGAMDDALG